MFNSKIRNIAIIAHVDHGKTTLVEKIIQFCAQGVRQENKQNTFLDDNNELEKERGITILSKNVAVNYKNTKINLIDTPGHADFGGEVERVINMSDGVLLLVDAFEGPMPQTRYVLSKALAPGKKIIVVINKVDKPNSDPQSVHEKVFDLMVNLNADDEQLDFPVVFGSAKNNWMGEVHETPSPDIRYLLDIILKHIPPPVIPEGNLQLQINSIDYSNYLGRIAVGRVFRGKIKKTQPISLMTRSGEIRKMKIKDLFIYHNLEKQKTDEVFAGDICAVSGLEGFEIGETIADPETPEAMPLIPIDEPTMSMIFTINNSPFFGQEGKFVTSRQLRERLFKETEKDLSLKVVGTDSADIFNVFGRGVLHFSILIETMRREGFELQLGKPKVLTQEIDGKKHEPIENLYIDTPEIFMGKIINEVSEHKGNLLTIEEKGDLIHLEFEIPSRGLIGLRSAILTISAGQAVMNHNFKEFAEYKGNIPGRINGVIISMEEGIATAYSIYNLQDRGKFFINPGQIVYEGMIIGENSKETDLVVNVIKGKKLTNVRASGSDEKLRLEPPIEMSLEEYLEYIEVDEYLEVTPESFRLRKIFLKEYERKRSSR